MAIREILFDEPKRNQERKQAHRRGIPRAAEIMGTVRRLPSSGIIYGRWIRNN